MSNVWLMTLNNVAMQVFGVALSQGVKLNTPLMWVVVLTMSALNAVTIYRLVTMKTEVTKSTKAIFDDADQKAWDATVESALTKLPNGWVMDMYFDGSWVVELYNPDGRLVDLSRKGGLNEQVAEAIQYANDHS